MASGFRLGTSRSANGRRVGVEIGETSLNLVEVKGAGAKTTVQCAAAFDLGDVAGRGLLDPEGIADVLADAWETSALASRDLVVGLDSYVSAVRVIEFPGIPKKDLVKSLPYELENSMPFPSNEATFSVVDLGSVPDAGQHDGDVEHRVMVLAAHAPRLRAFQSSLRTRRFRLHAVDLPAFGTLRAGRLLRPAVGVTAMVALSSGDLHIVVQECGVPLFARTVQAYSSAGGALSRRLSEDLATLGGGGVTSSTRAAGIAELDPLADAVAATLDYHEMSEASRPIDQIEVIGEGSRAAEFAANLRRHVELPVVEVRPSADDAVATVDSEQLPALGLALIPGVDTAGPAWPDLMPKRLRAPISPTKLALASTGVGVAAAAGLIFVAAPDVGTQQTDVATEEQIVGELTDSVEAAAVPLEAAAELELLTGAAAEMASDGAPIVPIGAAVVAGAPVGSTVVGLEFGSAASAEMTQLEVTAESADADAVQSWIEMLNGIDGLAGAALVEIGAGVDEAASIKTIVLRADVQPVAAEGPGA